MTFAYLASTSIFIMFSWGRYAMLGSCLALLGYSAVRNHMKLQFRWDAFVKWEIGFVAFSFCSVLWAVQRGSALRKSISLFEIALFTELINAALPREGKGKILLHALMWTGYVEALYLLFAIRSGRLTLLDMEDGRMSNALGNANFVGMIMAVTIIVTLYSVFFENARFVHLLALPCFYILGISQSRTAFIGFLFGVVCIMIVYIRNGNSAKNVLWRVLLLTIGCVLLLYITIEKHLLDGMIGRIGSLQTSITSRSGDGSANIRLRMIEIGFQTFLKYPLLGTGIGTSGNIVLVALGRNTYFHDNFVELLACGGILGFIAFYWPYFYMLKKWWRYRFVYRFKPKPAVQMAIILLSMLLIMDIGTVSYSEKNMHYYILLLLTQTANWRAEAFSDDENE